MRAGGHSVGGFSTCDGGVVIDLSGMREVTVDPQVRRARVAGGALGEDLDRGAQAFALACPSATSATSESPGSPSAAAWVASNAGTGSRPTNFLSVEMVTAEGRIVRAGEHGNPDLLWRLRGAGTEVSCKTQLKGAKKWQENRRKQKI